MACEIVRFVPPELVSVPDFVLLWPTGTVPKLMVDGLTVSWPAATAAPDSDTVTEGTGAVLEIAIVPETLPAVWGE